MKVIFSFDYENYVNPNADEAGKLYADLLTRHGIRGCFMVVGERARALRARGRHDIIRALQQHDIGFHTDQHDVDPTPTERLDALDWDTGVDSYLTSQINGIRVVEEIFGQFPSAFTQPGTAWAPQMFVAMRQLGIPVMTDSPFELSPGVPLWYCNSLHVDYHQGLERYFNVDNRLAAMQKDFEALCEARRDGAATDGVVVITTHPTQLTLIDWPTRPNPYRGRSPREVWVMGNDRPETFVRSFLNDLDRFLHFLVDDVKAEIITYRDLYAQFREDEPGWHPLADVVELAAATANRLTHQICRRTTFSPAEIFGLMAHTLGSYRRHGSLPEVVPLRRILGPIDPAPVDEFGSQSVSTARFLEACEDASWRVEQSGHMPSEILVGDLRLGPGTFLGAMARLVCLLGKSEQAPDLPDSIRITKQPELPELAGERPFTELVFRGTWRRFPPDFEGANVLRWARLQSWTAKPATRT